jgi:streptogramin lyase
MSNIERRTFLGTLLAAGAAAAAASDVPARAAKVVKLFKSPDGHPNAMETVPEGFWIGEQTTDVAHLMSFEGKLIRSVPTESSNTSGIAYGGGYLWMGANGKAIGRPARPTDATAGEVVQVDPANGKTVKRFPVPGGGGIHGLVYAEGSLWITSLRLKKLSQMDPKDFHVMHQIPVPFDRAHGLDFDGPDIWCMFSTDHVIVKMRRQDGRVLEKITIAKEDPDPHGMCRHNGHLYYCDAGIAPTGVSNNSPHAGYICRVDV